MLDLRTLVDSKQIVEENLKKRNMDRLLPVLEAMVKLDAARRSGIQVVEGLKAQKNAASQEIAKLKKSGGDASALLEKMKGVSEEIKTAEASLALAEDEIGRHIYEFPNILDASVPVGKSADDNKEIRQWGTKPTFSFTPKLHDEIGEKMGILDFKKAGEVTGARFVFLKGLASKLERALIQLMLDTHSKVGYEEMLPPFLVNRSALVGTGQLPKFEEDVFRIEKFDYFLIPTAEVPITNYHRNEILEESSLTKKYCAYSPCFRSEAGSYGKDTKGMKRQHQFDKIELVKFCRPEDSMAEHEALTADAEKILQILNLPYRTMALSSGDISFSSAKTYDIEVWSPAINGYMEISSCSNFGDYQARRANIRYRDTKTNKVQFVHTLNGSGLAVGRTLLAIMENYQKEDGTFEIPEALKPYLR